MALEEYFRGGPMSPFWWVDQSTLYHNKLMVTLDHTVDAEKLKEAWEKTKKVYPLIDMVPDMVNGEIVFFRDGRSIPPIESVSPVSPGSELCGGRAFSLTYFDRSIALSSYHSVADGGGVNIIFSTLIYFYLALYTGQEDEVPPVQTRENRKPEEYYKSISTIETSDFTQQEMVSYKNRKGMFIDPEMAADENGEIQISRITMSSVDFMKACKKIGANPSSMMALIMAKAAYKLHPDKKGDIAFVFTMSARKTFGIPDTIANCSTNILLPIEYEKVMGENLSDAVKVIREMTNYQRSGDYIKTYAHFFETYDWILAKLYAILTYVGTLDMGTNTKHITSLEMTDDSVNSLFMIELNGTFTMSVQFGKATGIYTEVIREILKELGVDTELTTPPTRVPKDVSQIGGK